MVVVERMDDEALPGSRRLLTSGPRLDPVGYIYVIGFSFGVIEVGKTNAPRLRMKKHERDVARYGGTITRAWLSSPHPGYGTSEVQLIRTTTELGDHLGSVEYFQDCAFGGVVEGMLRSEWPGAAQARRRLGD